MKITRKEVEHIAQLARLELQSNEVDQLTGQLDTILSYVDKLDELDTKDVAVTTHTQNVCNAFREDVVLDSIERKKALANGPRQNSEAFVVPRIIT